MLTLQMLDISNADDVKQLEEVQYQVFAEKMISANEEFSHVDHTAKRFRPRIPYEDLRTIIGKHNGTIVCGMTLNINLNHKLQLETLGFSIDKTEPDIAEGRGFFITSPFIDGESTLFKVRDYAIRYLQNNQINKVYGCCFKNLVRGYKLLGFNELDSHKFNGEEVYFLESVTPQ